MRIDIIEQNGHSFTSRLSNELVIHLWSVLGQDIENLQTFKTSRIPNNGFCIKYKLKEPVHLPHISGTATFDFYQFLPDDLRDFDIKPIVLQSVLVGPNEE